MHKYDISVVCTFHDEGHLVGATLNSLLDAVRHAKEKGIGVEIILALDRPSADTDRLVKYFGSTIQSQILEYDLGDQGFVRNECVHVASGEYVAFLDGDDLFGYDWLWKGYEDVCKCKGIVHPEINLFFEGRGSIFVQKSSSDDYFNLDYFRVGNYWDAMCMCSKDVLQSFPYRKRNIELGFAYEDWDWNMRTLANGIEHHVVTDTIHFKRARKVSQSKRSRDRGVVFEVNELSAYNCSGYDSPVSAEDITESS